MKLYYYIATPLVVIALLLFSCDLPTVEPIPSTTPFLSPEGTERPVPSPVETTPAATATIAPTATPTMTSTPSPPTPTPIGKFTFDVIPPQTPAAGVFHNWYGVFVPDEKVWLRTSPDVLPDNYALIPGSVYWDSLRPGERYAVYCVYTAGGWWWGSSDLCPTNTRPSGLWFCMFNGRIEEWYGEYVKGETLPS